MLKSKKPLFLLDPESDIEEKPYRTTSNTRRKSSEKRQGAPWGHHKTNPPNIIPSTPIPSPLQSNKSSVVQPKQEVLEQILGGIIDVKNAVINLSPNVSTPTQRHKRRASRFKTSPNRIRDAGRTHKLVMLPT
jgi:hypothetical protein